MYVYIVDFLFYYFFHDIYYYYIMHLLILLFEHSIDTVLQSYIFANQLVYNNKKKCRDDDETKFFHPSPIPRWYANMCYSAIS